MRPVVANMTLAACGCTVWAVGSPESSARLEVEKSPCERCLAGWTSRGETGNVPELPRPPRERSHFGYVMR